MDTENQNQEVDIFSMSDEEFLKLEQGSLVQSEESTEVDSSFETEEQETVVDEEQADTTETESTEDDEYIDVPDDEEEEDTSVDDEPDNENEEKDTDEESVNYETEFKKIIGTPIKANGTEITVDNPEDAIRLMQMGMNYSKTMAELKPARKIIAMLENNQMLDEDKLSYAIDLLNKNPQAINKLISESGIDKFDLDEEQGKDYKPTDYRVPDKNIELGDALNNIKDTPTYARTVNIIGKEWDMESRNIISNQPEIISVINSHVSEGIYDTVQQEVQKRQMLGTLPQGISNIAAYKLVGDDLYAQGKLGNAPTAQKGQHAQDTQANVKPPIKRPNKETVNNQKKSASIPRKTASVTKRIDDVFGMSDEEFLKKYGNI